MGNKQKINYKPMPKNPKKINIFSGRKNLQKINLKQGRKNLAKMLALLREHYPKAKTALNFTNPLEILVATILSAQCTDKRVNIVTPALFKKYRTARDYAETPSAELENAIHSTGFFRNKTKSIRGACKAMTEKYKGHVPKTMKEILTLPGIARKSANVILHNAYGVVEGIIVDTHMRRLSHRLGLSAQQNAEKIEQDLMKIVDRPQWASFAYMIVNHGRNICKAVKPNCAGCFLNKLCPSAFAFDEKGKWIGSK